MIEVDKADLYFLAPLGASEDDITTTLLGIPSDKVVLLGGYAVMQAALTLPESDCFIALSGIDSPDRSICCILTSATQQELVQLAEKAGRLVNAFAVQAISEIE